jgi:hypothetical protein
VGSALQLNMENTVIFLLWIILDGWLQFYTLFYLGSFVFLCGILIFFIISCDIGV